MVFLTNFSAAVTTTHQSTTDDGINPHGWSIFAELPDGLALIDSIIAFALGFIGCVTNLIALIVLSDGQLRGKGPFILIRSLASVDLLSCLIAIYYGSQRHPMIKVPQNSTGDFLCKAIFSRFLYYIISAVSAWHIVMISIERYLSIVHPKFYEEHFGFKLNMVMIFISWCVGFYTMSYNLFIYHQKDSKCNLSFGNSNIKELVGVEEFLAMVVLPVFIMSILYYHVYKKFKQFKRDAQDPNAPVALLNEASAVNPKGVLFTILALIAVYILSWCPNEILWVFYCFGAFGLNDNMFVEPLFSVCQIMINLNAVCNPILYASYYGQFRLVLKQCAYSWLQRIQWCVKCSCCLRNSRRNSLGVDSSSNQYRATDTNAPPDPDGVSCGIINSRMTLSCPEEDLCSTDDENGDDLH